MDNKRPRSLVAYVQELGLVKLDPQWLVPADILQVRTDGDLLIKGA